MDRPPAGVAALIAVALLVGACSSTSKVSQRKTKTNDGATTTVAGDSVPATSETTVAGAGAGTGTGGASSTGKAGAPTGGGAGGAVPDLLGAVRPPTGGKLAIGVITEAPITAGATIGVTKNIDYGNIQTQAQGVIDYINAHGGLGGKKLEPVFFQEDQNRDNYAAVSQAACAKFTEDNKVFAVVSTFLAHAELADCLAQKKTPLISENRIPYDRTTFSQIGDYLYMPGRMNGTRWGRVMVDGLHAQGYFTGGKVGLARFDAAVNKRVADESIKPQLAKHGLKLASEFAVSTPNGLGDFGGVAAQAGNAVLRFRSAGVNRVIFDENNGILPFFFLPAASGQGFHPRYGLQSENGINTLQAYYPGELKGAQAVGWLPPEDTYAAQDPNDNPAAKVCDEIMRKVGQAAKPTSGRVVTVATRGECDGLFFLKHALDRAKDFTAGGLKAAVEGLGDSYNSPITHTTHFGPGRHDGASSVRYLKFDDGCACFKYYSGRIPTP